MRSSFSFSFCVQIRVRLDKFLQDNNLNTSQLSEMNRVLARDSQYATSCQLETSEEELPVLAVSALITDPVSLSDLSVSPRLQVSSWLLVLSVSVVSISAACN